MKGGINSGKQQPLNRDASQQLNSRTALGNFTTNNSAQQSSIENLGLDDNDYLNGKIDN